MSNGPTGSMIIANLGLLKNSGLEISPILKQEIQTFNTSNISGSVQRIVGNASPAIKTILESAPVCFTGFLPNGIQIPAIANSNNLPQSILSQANLIFKTPSGGSSVAAFIHMFTLATAFGAQASSAQASVTAARSKSFGDLGAQFKNYNDLITGGISSQFVLSGVPALAQELPNFGTMFNAGEISNISKPGALVTNLYSQGLGDIGNLRKLVEENEITLDFVDDFENNLLLGIFNKITGEDLGSIIKATNFKPKHLSDIKTLADVFDINKILSAEALAAIGPTPSLEVLSNKLTNIGGKFSSMADVGKFLLGINLKTFPTMGALTSILPDDLADELNAITSKGSSSASGILITDIIGSVSGTNYTSRISAVNAIQSRLLASNADVRTFKNQLELLATANSTSNSNNSNNTTNNSNNNLMTNTELQSLVNRITSNPSLINILEEGNQHIIVCAEYLKREQQNLQMANAVPGLTESTIADIQLFVNNLSRLTPDSDTLKIADFISTISTNDIYGEALKAVIVEGQNLARMAAFGINVNTNLS